jgi:ribosomal protein S18 acetylase RimI-like enzyme
MIVRPYQPQRAGEASEVVRLWRTSFEHGVGIVDPHPLEEQLAHFVEQVVPHHRVEVAVDDARIAAFIACTTTSVAHLYVAVPYIGRGIGSRLLDIAKHGSGGSLWLYTFARNGAARRFYERHGFREVERECENMWRLEAIRYAWQRDAPTA